MVPIVCNSFVGSSAFDLLTAMDVDYLCDI